MNSNYGKSNKSASVNAFDFDFGINTSCSRSLNDQKNQNHSFASTESQHSTMSSAARSWQANKPLWTHQPAPSQSGIPGSLSGPTSMVGDIFGKSWASSNPSDSASGIGLVNKSPNLFGDLLSSAMEQNKGNSSNVPLKNSAPISNKSAYSMGEMADSLPKTGSTAKSSGNWGSNGNTGSYTGSNNSVNVSNTNNNKGSNLGGLGGSGNIGGVGMSSSKDPFSSLVDFKSKPAPIINSSTKQDNKTSSDDNVFGNFQNASRPVSSFQPNAFPPSGNKSMGSSVGAQSKVDDFGFFSSQSQPPVHSSGVDAIDSLFSSPSSTVGADTKTSVGSGVELFSGADDWGLHSDFGEHDSVGTTEIEGLPPPPAGVTASVAKNKGIDNQKQGQYADAIKWLSWAVILFEKSGDDSGTIEVLSCRALCYKEVGEYKKAVADCSKALEQDDTNVSILVQRALLYESMEKYKLGAEDLRTVMKLDPSNRVARNTIHRLSKMAG